jgi:hypothetical protein
LNNQSFQDSQPGEKPISSTEVEHRRIAGPVSIQSKKKQFVEVLSQIHDVDEDTDFERVQ